MTKIFKEIIVFICVLVVAAIIIVPITLTVTSRTDYDTFNGSVNKIPIDISSPTYGIILSMSATEGSTVKAGQTLATIQILDSHFTAPASNKLYSVKGNILSIQSPADGILGKIAVAAQSTIANSQMFMQIYTADNTDIDIFLPSGKDVNSYASFSTSSTSGGTKYPLQVIGQIPTDGIGSVSPTTSAYRARCVYASDCQKIVASDTITIYAQKKHQKSLPFNIPFFSFILMNSR